MKKRFVWGLTSALLITLSACGDNNNNNNAPTATPATADTSVEATATSVTSDATATPDAAADATATPVTETNVITDTPLLTDTTGVDVVPDITDTVDMTTGVNGVNDVTGAGLGEPRSVLRASELLDYDVENFAGEDLGGIEDAIVSLPDGCINYMVLSFGGILGLGDSQYLIPWRAVSISQNTNRLLLNVDPNLLTNAPVFDNTNLPDFNNPDWDADLTTFWQDIEILNNDTMTDTMSDTTTGATDVMTGTDMMTATESIADSSMMTDSMNMAGMMPCNMDMAGTTGMTDSTAMTDTTAAQGELTVAGMNAIRLSDLLGYDVRNSQGEDLGSIEDIMIDWHSDRIAYAILSFGGFLGLGDKWFPIPLGSLTLDPAQQRFIFDVDQARLETAPGFNPNELPDTANPDWDVDIRNYWTTNQ